MNYLSLTEDKYLTDKVNSFMVIDVTALYWDCAIVYYNLSYSQAKAAKRVLDDMKYKAELNSNGKTQSIKDIYIVCHRDDRRAIEQELFYEPEEW